MRSLFRSLPVLLVPGLALAACDSPSGPGRAGPPARLDIVSGDLQTTGTVGSELPQPLVVRVLDEKGKPVPNQIVNFRVTAGGGSVFAGTAQTNGDGEARERWSLGTVAHDTQRVEARAVDSSTGAPLVFATFRAVGRPDAPAAIAVAGAAARTGVAGRPIADSLAVKVSDRYGNAVPGVAVAWTALSGGGSLSPPTSTTGSDGVARAQWTLGSDLAAPQAAEAAVGALRAGFTATAAAPFSGLVGAGGNQQTGATGTALADSVAVRAVDHTGAAVAGVTVEWQVLSGGGSVSPATSVTGADGIARTRWTLGPTAGEQRMHGRARIGPRRSSGSSPPPPRSWRPRRAWPAARSRCRGAGCW